MTVAAVETQGTPRAVCADIGGSHMKFGLSAGPGLVRAAGQIRTPAQDWDAFRDALAGAVTRLDPGGRLPLAVSVAATLDRDSGRAISANIPCLAGHDLPDALAALTGRAVVVANDADSFALAEASVGAARGHHTVFALILGTGVGGGLVVGGTNLAGPGGVVAEWGHGAIARTKVTLPDGTVVTLPRFACGCGRTGCLDTIGGARGMERLHHHLTGVPLNSYQLLDRWEAGCMQAGRSIALWIELLAEPLGFLTNVLGTTLMPVGGGLAARTALIGALDRAVRARTLYPFTQPLVVPGQHRRNGGLVGVSVLAGKVLA